jgi:hypothetical protein
VGVYQARGACGKYCPAPIPGVPSRGRYALEVRNTVAHALLRARMPYGLVIRSMQEDYRLTLSLGSKSAHTRFVHSRGEFGLCLKSHLFDSGRDLGVLIQLG